MLAEFAQSLNGPVGTARLQLEPLTAAHADVLFTPLQDERIYHWISAWPPGEVEHVRQAWGQRGSRLSPDGNEAWLNWAVRRASDGAYMGKVDATVDAANVATHFGYVFFPEFWNQGYASECARGMVEHLAQRGVLEVHAFVTQGNVASERALARAGFIRTRIIPDNDKIRGVFYADIEYVHHAPAL
jgi:[ribosomal protein S5]-alanine N-acetyltransferase